MAFVGLKTFVFDGKAIFFEVDGVFMFFFKNLFYGKALGFKEPSVFPSELTGLRTTSDGLDAVEMEDSQDGGGARLVLVSCVVNFWGCFLFYYIVFKAPLKGCLLEAFEYIKRTIKPPLGGAGIIYIYMYLL